MSKDSPRRGARTQPQGAPKNCVKMRVKNAKLRVKLSRSAGGSGSVRTSGLNIRLKNYGAHAQA